jgi:hypothetical protein
MIQDNDPKVEFHSLEFASNQVSPAQSQAHLKPQEEFEKQLYKPSATKQLHLQFVEWKQGISTRGVDAMKEPPASVGRS